MDVSSYFLIGITFTLLFGLISGLYIGKYKYSTAGEISKSDFDEILRLKIEFETKFKNQIDQNEKSFKELNELRTSNSNFQANISALNVTIQTQKDQLENQKSEFEKLNEKFTKEFENLANKVLKTNAEDFNKISSEKLDNILNPLKENLTRFEKKVEENREKSLQESTSLKEQILQLTNLNQQMSDDAKNLTNALKGQSKTRGNWGEMILETILDQSGLEKDVHYKTQVTLKNEEGDQYRPDVIINLPGGKNLVVDSKLSLVAYEKFNSSDTDEEKNRYRKEHVDSMKKHVADLSNKDYDKLVGIKSPDMVFMFIPIEPALAFAMQADVSLYHDSLKKGIVLVTPSTFIATLKIIYYIWQQEKQNDNALQIAETGGRLYDKFVGFLEDLESIGGSIDKSKATYESAVKKLSTGRGNAIGIAERMKELGAKTNKSIPAKFIEE